MKKRLHVKRKETGQDKSFLTVLINDLALYKDVLQWSAVLFGHSFDAPDLAIIESYFYWLGKIPVSKPTRSIAMFFLGMFKKIPASLELFEPPVFVDTHKQETFKVNHSSPFLEEAVGLNTRDISNLNVSRNFRIVNKVYEWYLEGYTIEQLCVLSFVTGQLYGDEVLKSQRTQ